MRKANKQGISTRYHTPSTPPSPPGGTHLSHPLYIPVPADVLATGVAHASMTLPREKKDPPLVRDDLTGRGVGDAINSVTTAELSVQLRIAGAIDRRDDRRVYRRASGLQQTALQTRSVLWSPDRSELRPVD